jgi:hypothetical protein
MTRAGALLSWLPTPASVRAPPASGWLAFVQAGQRHWWIDAQASPVGSLLQAEVLVAAWLAEGFAQMEEFRDRCDPSSVAMVAAGELDKGCYS